MAVRAVQEIPSPPLANSRDRRELVRDSRREQDPPRRQHSATGKADDKPLLDRSDVIRNELYAVCGHLCSTRGKEVGRRHSVTGQETLHVCCGSVAGRTSVDDCDAAPGSPQHQRRAQSGGSASDHDDVICRCVRVHQECLQFAMLS
jgi:hypothetical protein